MLYYAVFLYLWTTFLTTILLLIGMGMSPVEIPPAGELFALFVAMIVFGTGIEQAMRTRDLGLGRRGRLSKGRILTMNDIVKNGLWERFWSLPNRNLDAWIRKHGVCSSGHQVILSEEEVEALGLTN